MKRQKIYFAFLLFISLFALIISAHAQPQSKTQTVSIQTKHEGTGGGQFKILSCYFVGQNKCCTPFVGTVKKATQCQKSLSLTPSETTSNQMSYDILVGLKGKQLVAAYPQGECHHWEMSCTKAVSDSNKDYDYVCTATTKLLPTGNRNFKISAYANTNNEAYVQCSTTP